MLSVLKSCDLMLNNLILATTELAVHFINNKGYFILRNYKRQSVVDHERIVIVVLIVRGINTRPPEYTGS